tara:strand:+ start:5215 stop:6585 length:1371 start_codon:yes stop_codon:yes gene_type:complete
MKNFKQFVLTEARGFFMGHHIGDDVVFKSGPYASAGSFTIVSHDMVSDVHTKVDGYVQKGYEVAQQWTGPDKEVTDTNSIDGYNDGRIIVLDSQKKKAIVVIYGKSKNASVSPRRFNLRYSTSTESLDLKPQSLGLKEKPYSTDSFANTVINAVLDRKDLDPAVKGYLELLVEYYWNNYSREVANDIKNEYGDVLSSMPMGQIKKNFGEIIGPLAILASKSVLFKSMKFNKKDKILLPLRGNEELVDFYLIKDGRQIPFSAKSGRSTTNLVKPGNIVSLIDANPSFKRKYGRSLEVKVMRDLASNVATDGPMVAAYNLNRSVKEFKKISKEMLEHWTSNSSRKGRDWEYIPELYDDYAAAIGLNTRGRKKPTFGEILYYTETTLAKASKGGILDYSEMFNEVVGGAVNYINLVKMDKNGLPVWETSEGGRSTAHLRTKNGTTRIATDKIGLQIHTG